MFRKLRRDQFGSIFIQATLIVVVIFGMIGLALDGGRYFMLDSDLQDLADAAALAGAKKLDGTAGAMSRADTAARGVLNTVRWGDVTAPTILAGTAGVSFYEVLDGPQLDPASAADDKLANYIKVTTGTWGIVPTFLRVVGATQTNWTLASATAQSGIALCVPATMMLCNPNEPTDGSSTGNSSSFSATPGQEFVFSTTGNSAFSPGVFNLLDTPSGSGADQAISNFLSQQSVSACSTGGISPAQGQKTNATIDGINVRFDQAPQNSTGLDTQPAPVKIDGMVFTGNGNGGGKGSGGGGNGNNACKVNQLTQDTPTPYSNCAGNTSVSCALPSDATFTSVGGSGGSKIGNGVSLTDLQSYWSNHHGTTTLPAGVTTRYQAYAAEVNGTGTAAAWNTESVEKHAPQCLAPGTETTLNRRVVHVAIVDCNYWNIQGNSTNNIRISEYADFFLIKPSDGNIYTEFMGTHGIDANGSALHSIVRLVR